MREYQAWVRGPSSPPHPPHFSDRQAGLNCPLGYGCGRTRLQVDNPESLACLSCNKTWLWWFSSTLLSLSPSRKWIKKASVKQVICRLETTLEEGVVGLSVGELGAGGEGLMGIHVWDSAAHWSSPFAREPHHQLLLKPCFPGNWLSHID